MYRFIDIYRLFKSALVTYGLKTFAPTSTHVSTHLLVHVFRVIVYPKHFSDAVTYLNICLYNVQFPLFFMLVQSLFLR